MFTQTTTASLNGSDHTPAHTKPVDNAKPITKSPQLSHVDGMSGVHKSLEQRAQRIKLLQRLEQLLMKSPALLGDAEAFVASL